MAMPLALIINELVTNAMKHGLHHRVNPIRVGLVRDVADLELFVGDDGPGFDLEAVRQNSSGLRLVEGLARQLRAKFEVTQGSRPAAPSPSLRRVRVERQRGHLFCGPRLGRLAVVRGAAQLVLSLTTKPATPGSANGVGPSSLSRTIS